jgi:hypothetical protein
MRARRSKAQAHIVVDTQGNLLAVVVHSAGSQTAGTALFKILPKRWIAAHFPVAAGHNVRPKDCELPHASTETTFMSRHLLPCRQCSF